MKRPSFPLPDRGSSRSAAARLAPILIGVAAAAASGQGIRKNFTEMTTQEKDALVSAFHSLGDASGSLVREIALFHQNNFNADDGGIHQSMSEANNVFHAWHRYAAFELEQEMQKLNPHITIPYWNWLVNSSPSDPLWSSSFMGGFNSAWGLARVLGGENGDRSLPNDFEVEQAQILTSWWVGNSTHGQGYSQQVENASCVHPCAHSWVGGVMESQQSPRDPIFWLHHNMVDRLWQEWEEQEPELKTQHTKTSMPRYNGTYRRPGDNALLPSVNPNSIIDSRSLGVFYTWNGEAMLDNYSVANKTRNPEQFTFQGLIRSRNFTVPAGKACKFRSATSVQLESGFTVSSGGSLTVEIVATGSLLAKTGGEETPIPPEPRETTAENNPSFRYRISGNGSRLSMEFPNPILRSSDMRGEIWDMSGKKTVLPPASLEGVYSTTGAAFDLDGVKTTGVHFFRVTSGPHSFSGKALLVGPR